MVVGCLAIVGALVLFFWLRSSDVFAVHRVTATAVERTSEQQIRTATADALGQNLLSLSTSEIEANLLALPYVFSASVHRRFPDTLEVRLTEFVPSARVKTDNGTVWLVTEQGRVLEKRNDSSLPLMLIPDDPDIAPGHLLSSPARNSLLLVGILKDEGIVALLPEVNLIEISTAGTVDLTLEGGISLRLGDPVELKHKLTVAGEIIDRYLRDGRELEYVDASVPDRVAVNAK